METVEPVNQNGAESAVPMLGGPVAEREGVVPCEVSPPIRSVTDVDAPESLWTGGGRPDIRVESTHFEPAVTVKCRSGRQVRVE